MMKSSGTVVKAAGTAAANETIKKIKYLEGGFLDKMTRREAGQILGIRESSNTNAVKDAHRKIMMMNHPDAGGSDFVAAKINEAKNLLLRDISDPDDED